MQFEDREAYLTEAAAVLHITRLADITDMDQPPIRIGVGTTSGRSSKTKGVCHPRSMSDDGHNEIVISPEIADPVEALDVLIHELLHAYDDCQNGHRGRFHYWARGVGLDGPLTATHAGETLHAELTQLAENLGPYPHAKLNLSKRKKAPTRAIGAHCSCGFKARLNPTQLRRVAPSAPCPTMCGLTWAAMSAVRTGEQPTSLRPFLA